MACTATFTSSDTCVIETPLFYMNPERNLCNSPGKTSNIVLSPFFNRVCELGIRRNVVYMSLGSCSDWRQSAHFHRTIVLIWYTSLSQT